MNVMEMFNVAVVGVQCIIHRFFSYSRRKLNHIESHEEKNIKNTSQDDAV